MSQDPKQVTPQDPIGAVAQFINTIRLVWRLMQDARVPTFPKLIIPAAIIYAISPIDLVPDLILGLGQVDDIAILAFSVTLFIQMCPPDIVAEHRRALAAPGRTDAPGENVVDGSYRVVPEDEDTENKV